MVFWVIFCPDHLVRALPQNRAKIFNEFRISAEYFENLSGFQAPEPALRFENAPGATPPPHIQDSVSARFFLHGFLRGMQNIMPKSVSKNFAILDWIRSAW